MAMFSRALRFRGPLTLASYSVDLVLVAPIFLPPLSTSRELVNAVATVLKFMKG